MKAKIYMAALAALSLAACSPEDYDSVSEGGLPVASEAKVSCSVDDETNAVTLTMDGQGQYVMWYLPVDGKEITKNPVYSTKNPLTKIWTSAGDYTVFYRVGNKDGLSQGMGQVSFSIKNSLTNYDELYAKLCGKEWRMANTEKGHMGCGPSGTDGTEWWTAAPNEKKDFGLYDDRLTFTADGGYTYDPGAGGTVFVNKECTVFAGDGSGEDFTAAVERQETSYSLTTEGESIYLTFPAKTLFPYIIEDAAYNEELRFRIESISGSKLELVYDNGSIAWHFILTSGGMGFQGFTAGSDCNMWKGCSYTNEFYYAPGWSQIADPDLAADGNSYTLTLPEATTEQWQCQVGFATDIATTASANYDFSMKLSSATTDIGGVTIKLQKDGDNDLYYILERVDLKAGEDYIFYKSDMAGLDIDKVKLMLDFGGAPANSKVNVYDICLQEHKCDGVEAPAEEEDKTVYTYDSESNIWKTEVDDKGDDAFTTEFYYAPNWSQIADPDFAKDGGKYTVGLAEQCFDKWQAQVKIKTGIACEAETGYDFSCKMTATKDIKGVTIKLTDSADDGNYLFEEQYDLPAGDEVMAKIPAKAMKVGAAATMTLVFDFGTTPADEKVEIYDIVLQKTAK